VRGHTGMRPARTRPHTEGSFDISGASFKARCDDSNVIKASDHGCREA